MICIVCKTTIHNNQKCVIINNYYYHEKCYVKVEFPHSPFYEWGKY